MAIILCFSYISVVLATNNTSLKSQMSCLAMLKFEVLTIGAFFWKSYCGRVLRYASARMRYESDLIGVIGPLGLHCCTLALSINLYWLLEEFGALMVLG